MREVGIKILEINKQKIIKSLLLLGARKHPTKIIIAKTFDFEDNRITDNHCLLRLRKVGEKTEIVFKESIRSTNHFKNAEETETEVGDFAISCHKYSNIMD